MSLLLKLIERRHLIGCFGTAFFVAARELNCSRDFITDGEVLQDSGRVSLSEWPQQSLSGKNNVRPGWPLSALTLTPSRSCLRSFSKPWWKKHETCGFCAISVHPHLSWRPGSWGIWTRQEQSPGPARQEHQWGRSISGTRTRPDLQYWSSFEGHDIHQDPAANSGTGCQPCPLHVSVDTRLLRPTQQPLAKPTPDINNLMGKTFLN